MCITQLRVMPFQYADDHTLYCVRVKLNNFRFYDIKRPFIDYVQFSQKLQQQLPKNRNSIPKLKKDSISKLLKSHTQKHMDRQEQLVRFIKALMMHMPPEIARSDFFMDFFSEYSTLPTTTVKNALKRVFSSRRPVINTSINGFTDNILSRSATISYMASPLPPQSNQQKQSMSANGSISSSSSSMHSSNSSSCSDIDMEDDIMDGGEINMIKLKIIYDPQNIIIIRVPRSISWDELDTLVRHKFALLNIDLPEKTVLQVTACRNSTSSGISNVTLTASVISTQDELSLAMQMNWSCLEKVALRVTL